MLLFEAKDEIDTRITESNYKEWAKQIPDYYQALEMASKCIEAQIRLADVLNDLNCDKEDSTYSKKLVEDILNQLRFDWEEDECISQ